MSHYLDQPTRQEFQMRLESLACDFFLAVITAPGLGKSITGGERENYFTFNYSANKVILLLTTLHHCRKQESPRENSASHGAVILE